MGESQFQAKWFADPLNYEEGLLRDRKADLYGGLRRDDKKCDFIKDVIAMANSARRHGEPARILMGVRNDGEVTGIGEFLSDYGQCDSDVERWENMKRSIQHIAGQYEDTSIPSFQTEELVLSEPVEHDSNFPAAAGAGKRVQHRSLQPSCERGSHRAIAYMLDRVFRGLWEREQRRTTQSPLNTGQWWERMGYFAMETDGKQRLFRYQTAADHLGSEQALYWVMSLGIITGASETLLKFVSELVKVYFAADRMISLHQTGETQLLRSEIQAAEREFRNRVLCMVDDLSVADVKEFI